MFQDKEEKKINSKMLHEATPRNSPDFRQNAVGVGVAALLVSVGLTEPTACPASVQQEG